MKKLPLLFALLFFSTFVFAAPLSKVIVGLKGKFSSVKTAKLASINDNTGIITNISADTLCDDQIIIGRGHFVDSVNSTYYCIWKPSAERIMGISTINGAVVSDTALSSGYKISGLQLNPKDGNVYGTGGPNPVVPGSFKFLKLNPKTGQITPVTNTDIGYSALAASGVINTSTNIYYYINVGMSANGDIVGVNIATGAIASSKTLTNVKVSKGEISDFVFNRNDGKIYCLRNIGVPKQFFLATMDPSTGTVTDVSITPVAHTSVFNAAMIDPDSNYYYFTTGHTLVAVNMSTGNLAKSTSISPDSNYYEYDIAWVEKRDTSNVITRPTIRAPHIYPNPASSTVNIEFTEQKEYSVQLADVLGRIVYGSVVVNTNKLTIPTAALPRGMYVVHITQGADVYDHKIVLE